VKTVALKRENTHVKSVTATAKKPSVSTGALALAAGGEYVVAVEATGAKKARNSHYTLEINELGVFTGTDNNSPETATALDGAFQGCLGKGSGADSVDWLDVADLDGFRLEALSGSLKVGFYGEDGKSVKASALTLDDGSASAKVASLTLKDGDRRLDAVETAALDEGIRYLKLEAAGSGVNSYRIGQLA